MHRNKSRSLEDADVAMRRSSSFGTSGHLSEFIALDLEATMQTPIERVMQAYGMMMNLTAEQEKSVRERLEEFLKHCNGSDQQLAIQGLQFLRGDRKPLKRKVRTQAA